MSFTTTAKIRQEPVAAKALGSFQYVQTTSNKSNNNNIKTGINPDHPILHQSSTPMTQFQITELMRQGFTKGLAESINQLKDIFALRIWIVDDSSSMNTLDGHKMKSEYELARNPGFNPISPQPCSRWEEIADCVEYHIKLSALVDAPTQFRLLNATGNKGKFSVCDNPCSSKDDDVLNALNSIRQAKPQGVTPLTKHIREVHATISKMTPELNELGRKVVIVIATDGLPSDHNGYSGRGEKQAFVDALRLLEGLPVWVVVRLCTDDDSVVEFYNDLDTQLELSMEVLDDFRGEALEVVAENPWVNYTFPIHRLREMGYHDRVFDMLDERLLTKSELRDYCMLLFGQDIFDGVPDPSLDWNGFVNDIERLLERENVQWNPARSKRKPWVSVKKLNRSYRSNPLVRLFSSAKR